VARAHARVSHPAGPRPARARPQRPAHTVIAQRVVRPRPLATQPVSAVRPHDGDSGGSALWPAAGIAAAAALVAGSVAFAFRRRHV